MVAAESRSPRPTIPSLTCPPRRTWAPSELASRFTCLDLRESSSTRGRRKGVCRHALSNVGAEAPPSTLIGERRQGVGGRWKERPIQPSKAVVHAAPGEAEAYLKHEVRERAQHATAEEVRTTCSFARAERLLGREYHGRFLIELLQNAADAWRNHPSAAYYGPPGAEQRSDPRTSAHLRSPGPVPREA
jgi:hypothetical protein